MTTEQTREVSASEQAKALLQAFETATMDYLDPDDDSIQVDGDAIRNAARGVLDYIASLEADRERIDWLEAHPHGCAVKHPDKWIVPDYTRHARNHRGHTLRGAIDAARLSASLTTERGDSHGR